MIKIGTCGFTYKHFNYFDVVEVQQTFYDVVSEETLNKWRKQGKNIEFTIKALQVITHEYNRTTYKKMKSDFGNKENFGFFKPTKEVFEAYEVTLKEAKILNAKVIIFQTPSSFLPTEENVKNLKNFFSSTDPSFIYGWEPRGEEWYKGDLLSKIFSELNIIHVVDPFRHISLTKKKYYRLHGIGKGEVNYSYKYTDEDLKKLAEIVMQEKEDVYVLFNNIYSFDDALRFKKLIKDLNMQ
ncbi:DUF72 domain-containing protein [Sulfurisphaera javensis]|uniref:DUF72 domain-containing protein n=1 Tax=Sulfurisphaera javensis TaxID=2049879 RepID=A0AAT9GQR0_9CREN